VGCGAGTTAPYCHDAAIEGGERTRHSRPLHYSRTQCPACRGVQTLTTLKTVAEAAAAFDSAAVSTPPVDRIAAVPVPATASGDDAVAVCPHTLTEGRAVPASTVVQAAVAAGPSDRCESSLLERQLHSKPASSAAAPGSGRHGHTSADVTEAPAAVPQPPAPLRRPASLAAGAADRPLHPQAESKAADGDAPWCCDGEGATASDREDADDGFRSNVTAWYDTLRPVCWCHRRLHTGV
jgi:hypothetical protein